MNHDKIPLPPGQAPPRKGSCPGGRPYGPAAIPLFQRGKPFSSLWYLFPAESRQREVGRDFTGRFQTAKLIRFVLFAPGDESPGYCHGCPACAEAFCLRQGSGRQAAGRPREGHQNRFKLALMPLAGGEIFGRTFSKC